MPLPLLPDAISLGREALLAQAPVTALVSTRIYGAIPGSPTWPLIELAIVDDDEARDPALGEARLQANCWGAGPSSDDKRDALALARTVRSVARDLRGAYASGAVVKCAPGQIIPAPDPQTGRVRFLVDLLLTSHA